PVCSGVPQGSHLGTFILFINDLPSIFNLSVNVLMFADDTKMYSIINNEYDIMMQFISKRI
ncbi:inositol monophosphatase 1-like, partial [Aphis craccivora]